MLASCRLIRLFNSTSCTSRSVQAASFSEITVTGSGQESFKPGIIIEQAAFRAGRIKLTHLIAGFGLICEHLISVRETLRNVQRAMVLLIQFDCDVLEVSWTFRAKIDDDVENRTTRASHDFCLSRRRELKVHPA